MLIIKVLIIKSKFLSGDFLHVWMPMGVLALEFIKMLVQVMNSTGFNCKCNNTVFIPQAVSTPILLVDLLRVIPITHP